MEPSFEGSAQPTIKGQTKKALAIDTTAPVSAAAAPAGKTPRGMWKALENNTPAKIRLRVQKRFEHIIAQEVAGKQGSLLIEGDTVTVEIEGFSALLTKVSNDLRQASEAKISDNAHHAHAHAKHIPQYAVVRPLRTISKVANP